MIDTRGAVEEMMNNHGRQATKSWNRTILAGRRPAPYVEAGTRSTYFILNVDECRQPSLISPQRNDCFGRDVTNRLRLTASCRDVGRAATSCQRNISRILRSKSGNPSYHNVGIVRLDRETLLNYLHDTDDSWSVSPMPTTFVS